MPVRRFEFNWTGVLCGVLLFCSAAFAEDTPVKKDEIKLGKQDTTRETKPAPKPSIITRSIEELMDIQVTTVAKRPERRAQAPAAIHVITQEDIRRSGVTSIAEALRMAPGMNVSRINSHRWAISARGFSNEFSNALLVMMDGRSIYTPLFSGTYWDVQDTMLEDIERIEVIRGPGATLWGANAVNGVINIITKNSKDTQGGLASGGAGTEEVGFGAVRYGGKVAENAYIRGYVKYFDRDDQAKPDGGDASDEWRMFRGGVRLDWDISKYDKITLQGDAYVGEEGDAVPVPLLTPPFSQNVIGDASVSGGNFLSRWSHEFSDTSNLRLQLYYDQTSRERVATLEETRDTFDLDFQHQFTIGGQHTVVWGAGYRASSDRTESGIIARFNPDERTLNLFSAFFQDEIEILKNRLTLTLGVKGEHNDFTEFEVQPNARLAWTPHERHFVWASVSRAVRTPSRAESDVNINLAAIPPGTAGPGTPAGLLTLSGNKHLGAERLIAYELGYRFQPEKTVSIDLAGFLNTYDNLIILDPRTPFFDPGTASLEVPTSLTNGMRGETMGGEAMVTWQTRRWWRLNASYSYLNMQLHADPGTNDPSAEKAEGQSPRNQFSLRSSMDLPHNLELDFGIRYVDSLARLNVPHYIVGDVRLGWKPSKKTELSIVGQNLFDDRHPEFRPSIPLQETEVQHSVYLKFTVKF